VPRGALSKAKKHLLLPVKKNFCGCGQANCADAKHMQAPCAEIENPTRHDPEDVQKSRLAPLAAPGNEESRSTPGGPEPSAPSARRYFRVLPLPPLKKTRKPCRGILNAAVPWLTVGSIVRT
jgi:hypothetical protein